MDEPRKWSCLYVTQFVTVPEHSSVVFDIITMIM